MKKNIAMLQVDLDGLDSVLDCYGSPLRTGETDLVYTDGVPRLLGLLSEYGIKATFFLIGKDAGISYKKEIIKRIAAEGHELANHTYSHPLSFARLPLKPQIEEIDRCSDAIASITGKRPGGFRAPGYAITSHIINALEERGFIYDSSVFPCSLSPLIRAWQSLISPAVFENKKYGPLANARAPLYPYVPDRSRVYIKTKTARSIYEIPVTTLPLLRLPFHGSYIMAISRFSPKAGLGFWKAGYLWYRARGIPYVFVVHPAELTMLSKDIRLKGQIGYDNPIKRKIYIYRKILASLKKGSMLLRTDDFVKRKSGAS